MKLRNYQEDCLELIQNQLSDPNCNKQNRYIVLPTGTGKTEIFKRISDKKILVLENQSGLRNDIAKRFEDIADDVLIVGNGTHLTTSLLSSSNSSIVVATIQTMSKDVDNIPSNTFDIVVIDEFHHTKSDCRYSDIINRLDYKLCIGFSATPPDKSCVFSSDEKLYEMSIFEAWRDGWLMKPDLYYLSLEWDKTKLSKALVSSGVWRDEDITNALIAHANENYELILNELQTLNSCEKSVVYFSSIDLANGFAEFCKSKGKCCYAITSKTKRQDREFYVESFRKNRDVILSNVWCLSEGIDIPSIECIVIARPLNDANKYKQIVGRVLRLSEGKKKCIVCDCIAEENNYLFQHTFVTAYCLPDTYGCVIDKEFYNNLVDELNSTKDIKVVADRIGDDFTLGYSLIKDEKLYDVDNHEINYYLTTDKKKAIGIGKAYERRFSSYLNDYVNDYDKLKFQLYFYIDLITHELHILTSTPQVISCENTEECFKYLYDKYCKFDNIFCAPYTHKKGSRSRSDKQYNYAVSLFQETYGVSKAIAEKVCATISAREASTIISKLSIIKKIKEREGLNL